MFPLVVYLWEYHNFLGETRIVVEDTPDIDDQWFNDRCSSIKVHPGPDYDAWKATHTGKEPVVTFFEGVNYQGGHITLTAGEYANIHLGYNFDDVISSIKFNSPPLARRIADIPFIIELYRDINYGGKKIIAIGEVNSIPAFYGAVFTDAISSAKIRRGPTYSSNLKVRLCHDVGGLGGYVQLDPGNYPDLRVAPYGINDVTSSIKIHRVTS